MNKELFKCMKCPTIITIESNNSIPDGYTPICPTCSGRTISMTSDEYAYGKLA